MDQPYWIISDTIIFKPDFNNELDEYIKIISQYKKLIFSNYFDPKITIETNNIYYYKYTNQNNCSLFNQPLSDSLLKLINLQQLTLGWAFNQPLSNSLSNLINLERLTFGNNFSQP